MDSSGVMKMVGMVAVEAAAIIGSVYLYKRWTGDRAHPVAANPSQSEVDEEEIEITPEEVESTESLSDDENYNVDTKTYKARYHENRGVEEEDGSSIEVGNAVSMDTDEKIQKNQVPLDLSTEPVFDINARMEGEKKILKEGKCFGVPDASSSSHGNKHSCTVLETDGAKSLESVNSENSALEKPEVIATEEAIVFAMDSVQERHIGKSYDCFTELQPQNENQQALDNNKVDEDLEKTDGSILNEADSNLTNDEVDAGMTEDGYGVHDDSEDNKYNENCGDNDPGERDEGIEPFFQKETSFTENSPSNQSFDVSDKLFQSSPNQNSDDLCREESLMKTTQPNTESGQNSDNADPMICASVQQEDTFDQEIDSCIPDGPVMAEPYVIKEEDDSLQESGYMSESSHHKTCMKNSAFQANGNTPDNHAQTSNTPSVTSGSLSEASETSSVISETGSVKEKTNDLHNTREPAEPFQNKAGHNPEDQSQLGKLPREEDLSPNVDKGTSSSERNEDNTEKSHDTKELVSESFKKHGESDTVQSSSDFENIEVTLLSQHSTDSTKCDDDDDDETVKFAMDSVHDDVDVDVDDDNSSDDNDNDDGDGDEPNLNEKEKQLEEDIQPVSEIMVSNSTAAKQEPVPLSITESEEPSKKTFETTSLDKDTPNSTHSDLQTKFASQTENNYNISQCPQGTHLQEKIDQGDDRDDGDNVNNMPDERMPTFFSSKEDNISEKIDDKQGRETKGEEGGAAGGIAGSNIENTLKGPTYANEVGIPVIVVTNDQTHEYDERDVNKPKTTLSPKITYTSGENSASSTSSTSSKTETNAILISESEIDEVIAKENRYITTADCGMPTDTKSTHPTNTSTKHNKRETTVQSNHKEDQKQQTPTKTSTESNKRETTVQSNHKEDQKQQTPTNTSTESNKRETTVQSNHKENQKEQTPNNQGQEQNGFSSLNAMISTASETPVVDSSNSGKKLIPTNRDESKSCVETSLVGDESNKIASLVGNEKKISDKNTPKSDQNVPEKGTEVRSMQRRHIIKSTRDDIPTPTSNKMVGVKPKYGAGSKLSQKEVEEALKVLTSPNVSKKNGNESSKIGKLDDPVKATDEATSPRNLYKSNPVAWQQGAIPKRRVEVENVGKQTEEGELPSIPGKDVKEVVSPKREKYHDASETVAKQQPNKYQSSNEPKREVKRGDTSDKLARSQSSPAQVVSPQTRISPTKQDPTNTVKSPNTNTKIPSSSVQTTKSIQAEPSISAARYRNEAEDFSQLFEAISRRDKRASLDRMKYVNLGRMKDGLTLLHQAAKYDMVIIVTGLYVYGAFIEIAEITAGRDAGRFRGLTARGIAEKCRHFDIVHQIDKFYECEYSLSALHQVARSGNLQAIQKLCENRMNVSMVGNHGNTPLYMAACAGRLQAIQLLLKYGADMTVVCDREKTVLHKAAEWGHLDVVKYFVSQCHFDVNMRSRDGITPLHLAAAYGNTDTVMFLLDHKALISLQSHYRETPLFWAVAHGNVDVVKLLVQRGARAELQPQSASGPTDWNFLHVAASSGHADMCMYLLDRGFDMHSVTHKAMEMNGYYAQGVNALHLAAGHGRQSVIKFLIESGADVDAKDSENCTPLHYAAQFGYAKAVQELINCKANVNVQNQHQFAPLHKAATNGHTEVIEILLNNDANIAIPVSSQYGGCSPLHLAAAEGHYDVILLLVKRGALMNAQDGNKQVPLHLAAKNGHLDVVRLLCSSGAAISCKDQKGDSPLTLALKKKQWEVAKFLKESGALGRTPIMHKFTRLRMGSPR
ncbi:uncharacterized protein LOC144448217 [Glandiceps talaboti]